MDEFEFTSSLVGSVAWPAVVAASVVILRAELKVIFVSLGGRMRHIKVLKGPGGTQVEFDDQVLEAKKDAAEITGSNDVGTSGEVGVVGDDSSELVVRKSEEKLVIPESADSTAGRPDGIGLHLNPSVNTSYSAYIANRSERVFDLARISPRIVIIESWLEVEVALAKVAKAIGVGPEWRKMSPARQLQLVRSVVDDKRIRDAVDVARSLRKIRDRAAHEIDLPVSSLAAIDYASSADSVARLLNTFAIQSENYSLSRQPNLSSDGESSDTA